MRPLRSLSSGGFQSTRTLVELMALTRTSCGSPGTKGGRVFVLVRARSQRGGLRATRGAFLSLTTTPLVKGNWFGNGLVSLSGFSFLSREQQRELCSLQKKCVCARFAAFGVLSFALSLCLTFLGRVPFYRGEKRPRGAGQNADLETHLTRVKCNHQSCRNCVLIVDE